MIRHSSPPAKSSRTHRNRCIAIAAFSFIAFSFSACNKNHPPDRAPHIDDAGLEKINHVVVIYLENHSFDNLFGEFPGANGIANAPDSAITQVDSTGTPYEFLPPIPGSTTFPTNLPNNLFTIDQYLPNDEKTPDVLHCFYQEQLQIDGGKMDKFALYNNTGGLSQGYYNTSMLPLLDVTQRYTLCDNFFHSAFGGSFLNHFWLISAASPTFPDAPATSIAQFDATGKLIKDGAVTPDGFVVNTSFSVNTPHPSSANPAMLVPNQTFPTIGDRLNEKNISWAWYSGGWDSAMAGTPPSTFQYHHQPFIYFANYADGTQAKKDHLKDEKEFIQAAKSGNLPAVSFVKPVGIDDEHPGYSNVAAGENHTVELINEVLGGPNGKDALIIVTYDENGGFWDHVAPPTIDEWGPGTRVPAIIISPFAKKGYVDHSRYETVSILSFIEKRWKLIPLTERDRNADPFSNALEF